MNVKDAVLGWGLIVGMVGYAMLLTAVHAGKCIIDAATSFSPTGSEATPQQ